MQKDKQAALARAIAINERFDRALATLSMPAHEPAKCTNAKKINSKKPLYVSAIGLVLALILTSIATDSQARRRHVRVVDTQRCEPDDRYACASVFAPTNIYQVLEPILPRVTQRKKAAMRAHAKKVAVVKSEQPAKAGTIVAYQEKIYREAKGVSLKGVVKPLVNWARELSSKCGSVVTSGVRKGAVICGWGRGCSTSNHALGRAIDMQGNPSCMAKIARKKGWGTKVGGMSYDYSSVNHYHFSYNPGGKEWRKKFAHNGYSTRRTRLARYRG